MCFICLKTSRRLSLSKTEAVESVGRYDSKKLDVGVGTDKIKSIADNIENDSAALFLHITSGKEGLLKTAVRNAGGKIAEVSFTDDEEIEISATMADFASRYDEG